MTTSSDLWRESNHSFIQRMLEMTFSGGEEAFFKAKIFLQRSMKYFPYCHFSLIIFMLDLWMKAGQSKNAKNSSVSDVRKVYTLLQSLSCKLRIWIDLGKNHGTQINCIYKIIARVFFLHQYFNHQCPLVRKNLVHHLWPLFQHLFHPTKKKYKIRNTIKTREKL